MTALLCRLFVFVAGASLTVVAAAAGPKVVVTPARDPVVVEVSVESKPTLWRLATGDELVAICRATYPKVTDPAYLSKPDERGFRIGDAKAAYPRGGRTLMPPPRDLGGDEHGNPRVALDVPPGRYLLDSRGDDRPPVEIWVRGFALYVHADRERGLTVLAIDAKTEKPIPGIELFVLDSSESAEPTAVTDERGAATLDCEAKGLLIARRGDDVRHIGLTDWWSSDGADLRADAFIATDRPIYQPGDSIQFKAILRERQPGGLAMPTVSMVTVALEELGWSSRQLRTMELPVSALGTVAGSFTLAEEMRSGTYRLRIGRSTCRVEIRPYRKPEFGATLALDESTDPPSVVVEARYGFGEPVVGGEVEWELYRLDDFDVPSLRLGYPHTPFRDVHLERYDPTPLLNSGRVSASRVIRFDGKNPGYWADWQDDPSGWLDEVDTDAAELTAGPLDDRGHRRGVLPRDLAPGRYHVRAVIVDDARYSYSFGDSFDLGRPTVHIEAGFDELFFLSGDSPTARCRVTDSKGEVVPDAPVEFALLARRGWEDRFTSDARVEYEWIASSRAVTDTKGEASYVFESVAVPAGLLGRAEGLPADPDFAEEGAPLRLRVRHLDDRSSTVRVPIPGFRPIDEHEWSWWSDESVQLLTDRIAYEVGESIRVGIESHVKGVGWLVVDHGRFEILRTLELTKGISVHEVPYDPAWGPSAHLGILTMAEGYPANAYRTVFSTGEEECVDIEIAFDREQYRPGESATLTIDTTHLGQPVDAELEIAIVDEAVFHLDDRENLDPARLFAHPLELGDRWGSGWTRGRSWGIGGGAVLDLGTDRRGWINLGDDDSLEAGSLDLGSARLRQRFVDTWHWSATTVTGADGRAEIELAVPDDLTEWRVVVRAVAGTSRFGVGVSETKTRQPLFARLIVPTLLREGDRTTVSALVHSQLEEAGTFTVGLQIEGPAEWATEDAPTTRTIELAPGASQRVELPVSLTKVGTATFRVEVAGQLGSDRVQIQRTVRPLVLQHAATLEGQLPTEVAASWSRTIEIPDDAITGSATVDVFVIESPLASIAHVLPGLMDYPYGCVEQTLSRFLPTVIARHATARVGLALPLPPDLDAMIRAGVDRLVQFQHEDGGWGWWRDDDTHPRMTRYAFGGLLLAGAHGVAVPRDVIGRGLEALLELDHTAETAWLLTLARDQGFFDGEAHPFGEEGAEVLAKLSKVDPDAGDPFALAYFVLAGRHELVSRITTDPPTLPYMRSTMDLALRLRAVAAVDPTDPRIDVLVEILQARRDGARWQSTLDTAHVVYAFCALAASDLDRPKYTATIDGDAIAVENGHARIDAARLEAGSHRLVITRSAGDPSAQPLPIRVTVRHDTRSGLAEPWSTRPHLRITRTIERRVSNAEGGGWAKVASGESLPTGTLLRITSDVASHVDLEYGLVEVPITGGLRVVPDPEEPDHWEDLRFDRVLFGEAEGYRGRLEQFYARTTVPGRYRIAPARVFTMYDPTIEARTAVFELVVE